MRWGIVMALGTKGGRFTSSAHADDLLPAEVVHRPRVPGRLRLITRRRKSPAGVAPPEPTTEQSVEQPIEQPVEWQVAETAIIVCDMWDDHWCRASAQRVGVLAPKMNAVLTAARSHGVMIIHAPSDTMDFYAGTPGRRRMQLAPLAKPPATIERWCRIDPKKEPPLPIDDSTGGCDDAVIPTSRRAWKRQHPAIDILDYDGISDSGIEVYNYCAQVGIRNLVLMGVHTNMCVLGRSFGIRQMTSVGMNVVLARDLTDAMYDPRKKPYVSHTRGTGLVIEHIETYWCPSIDSRDLIDVVPGSAASRGPA
jgi:nicotinamidase-related amidase